MQLMVIIKPIKINTRLFKRRERLFVLLPKSSHKDLERFEKEEFVQVLLQNDKQDKSFPFAARISNVKEKSGSSYLHRMYVEIPLPYRRHATLLKGSVIVTISPL